MNHLPRRMIALTLVALLIQATTLQAEDSNPLDELKPSDWQSLFNGKDLSGWQQIGGGSWKVEEGVIHGTSSKSEKRHGHLLSEKTYGNFALRIEYKAIAGNSGLYFRVQKNKGNVGVKGFQAEIDPEKDAGGLYETGGRGWVVKPTAEQVARWYKPGEWNQMTVIAQGGQVTVQVNGKTTAELTNDPGRKEGHIALQLHGGQDMDVMFRKVEIAELD